MKPSPEKNLATILNKDDPQSILHYIQKKVLHLNQLNAVWKKNWPDLAQHSRIANFREGCLVIEVDNAAWATRLRYLIPDLSQKLLNPMQLDTLKNIEWYIQPRSSVISPPKRSAPIVSEPNAHLLKNTALTIKVKQLQDALMRLSEKNPL